MSFDKELYNIFSQDISLPDSTTKRIAETLQQIRQYKKSCHNSKSFSAKIRLSRKRMVMLLAAALLMIICAGTVLAYAINHYDFINAIWRYDNLEEHLEQLEPYIGYSGASQQLFDYTVTIEEYLTDENGMGFVRYSIENPDGLPQMYDAHNGGSEYISGDTEIWFESDKNGLLITNVDFSLSDGTDANEHLFIDGKVSTETKAYFTATVTAQNLSGSDNGFIMTFSIYDQNNEQHCIRFELPSTHNITSVEYSDRLGGVRAKLSPVGIWLYGPDFYNGYPLKRLSLHLHNGYYTVTDNDMKINARKSTTVTSYGNYIIFERPINSDNIEIIIFNDIELTREFAETTEFDPSESPKYETDISASADRGALVLETAEENPFHFRRDDGIEVFVRTAETLADCSEEDVKDYTACLHGYLSYEDFLAEARNDYDEYYSSIEFISQNIAAIPSDGIIDQYEIIEKYLELIYFIDELSPDSDVNIHFITVSFLKKDDGNGYIWILTNDTDILEETVMDAATGEVIYPIIRRS